MAVLFPFFSFDLVSQPLGRFTLRSLPLELLSRDREQMLVLADLLKQPELLGLPGDPGGCEPLPTPKNVVVPIFLFFWKGKFSK